MKARKPRAVSNSTAVARAKKAENHVAVREQNRARLNAEMDALEAEVKATSNLRIAFVTEVCRRAGLSTGIINKPGYIDLREPFNNRVNALKAPPPSAPPKKKRKPAEVRAMQWKALFEAAVEQLRVTEVDLLLSTVRIEEALAEDVPVNTADNVVEIRP